MTALHELFNDTNVWMTDFVLAGRHFGNPEFGGTKIPEMTPAEFLWVLHALLSRDPDRAVSALRSVGFSRPLTKYFPVLRDGHAEFCKHIFVPNYTKVEAGVIPITPANEHLIRSGYKVRREGELPFLSRWIRRKDIPSGVPQAPWLDIVAYSKEQIEAEGEECTGDWGIVSINSAVGSHPDPRTPITILRDALGPEHGGSGATFDPALLQRAVGFWSLHVVVR